uniref:Uncharacterized protein n=1 Tax=Rhizophora mucronata TaxID=61149 RepID=A0A2P2Q195_RHIMU
MVFLRFGIFIIFFPAQANQENRCMDAWHSWKHGVVQVCGDCKWLG